jgi:hypothetical protein
MADETMMDRVGDLAHRAYNAVTGALSPASTPNKPAATSQDASQHLGTGIVKQGADIVGGRQKQINDAVDAAS